MPQCINCTIYVVIRNSFQTKEENIFQAHLLHCDIKKYIEKRLKHYK